MRIVLVLILVLGLGAAFFWQRKGERADTPAPTTVTRVVEAGRDDRDVGLRAKAKRPAASSAMSERTRDKLLLALTEAHSRRTEQAASGRVRAQGFEESTLEIANKMGTTSAWQERQLTILNQLLDECYQLARDEDPALTGTIGVQFRLRAEPEVGGLVDEISIMEDYSTIEQAGMRECIRESLYALELDAPEEGIEQEAQLTLRFEPE